MRLDFNTTKWVCAYALRCRSVPNGILPGDMIGIWRVKAVSCVTMSPAAAARFPFFAGNLPTCSRPSFRSLTCSTLSRGSKIITTAKNLTAHLLSWLWKKPGDSIVWIMHSANNLGAVQECVYATVGDVFLSFLAVSDTLPPLPPPVRVLLNCAPCIKRVLFL